MAYRLVDSTGYQEYQSFKLLQDDQMIGKAMLSYDGQFKAFLKTSDYGSRNLIGKYSTLPEAVTAIKEMVALL